MVAGDARSDHPGVQHVVHLGHAPGRRHQQAAPSHWHALHAPRVGPAAVRAVQGHPHVRGVGYGGSPPALIASRPLPSSPHRRARRPTSRTPHLVLSACSLPTCAYGCCMAARLLLWLATAHRPRHACARSPQVPRFVPGGQEPGRAHGQAGVRQRGPAGACGPLAAAVRPPDHGPGRSGRDPMGARGPARGDARLPCWTHGLAAPAETLLPLGAQRPRRRVARGVARARFRMLPAPWRDACGNVLATRALPEGGHAASHARVLCSERHRVRACCRRGLSCSATCCPSSTRPSSP